MSIHVGRNSVIPRSKTKWSDEGHKRDRKKRIMNFIAYEMTHPRWYNRVLYHPGLKLQEE